VDKGFERLKREVAERFERERRVLTFDQYLELVRTRPRHHLRDATRYVLDAMEYFGVDVVTRPWGEVRRYRAFELPSRTTEEPALVGQEIAQDALHRALVAFAREGRANRLVVLHGPNGSAKSTFVACLMRALEAFSQTDEGALYRFVWVFPRERDGKSIGFGSSSGAVRATESFALLPDDRIQSKLPDELREHPLLLLPLGERAAFLGSLTGSEGAESNEVPTRLRSGDLGMKNRRIFDALLSVYQGDIASVLAHVRVERITISRRYRVGAVTIGPELSVDAQERAISIDRSLAMLPSALSGSTLHETFGELVDGQRGVIEYGDLLERPIDAWKYLLLAVETGEVALRASTLAIDAVLLASSNDRHLEAFREHPAFPSFRARMMPIRVPYLLDYRDEQRIYDERVVPRAPARFSPHATFVGAYWAVTTRLRPARREGYTDSVLARAASSLRPEEKADLYATGRAPDRFDDEAIQALEANVPAIFNEHIASDRYEGRVGASPRELADLLLDAAAGVATGVVTPLDVLDRLEALCKRTDLEFLQQKPVDGYFDAVALIGRARDVWLDRVEEELREASSLLGDARHEELFDRYVHNVVHWVKGEKLVSPVTGQTEAADEDLMRTVEAMLGVRSAESHRREILSTIAAFAIDHPGDSVVNARVFPRMIIELRDAFFEERRRTLVGLEADMLARLDGSDIPNPERKKAADSALATLRSRFGYCDVSAKMALSQHRTRLLREDVGNN